MYGFSFFMFYLCDREETEPKFEIEGCSHSCGIINS